MAEAEAGRANLVLNSSVDCLLKPNLDGTDASVSVDCRLAVLVADVRRLPAVY